MKPFSSPSNNLMHALALSGLVVLAVILRYYFLAGVAISEFDPWRHLTLIENIRAGAGFTLFDGQTYIWYNAIWYHLAAMVGPAENAAWLSASLSVAALVTFFQFLRTTEQTLVPALAGSLMMAAYGPLITFTSGYGSESFALLMLLLACLVASYYPNRMAAFAAGLLFGIALVSRINFLFNLFLFVPLLKSTFSKLWFVSAAGAVLMAAWCHNHTVIAEHLYLFTWDGLSTRSADYSLLATLVPQLQPDVAAATRALYGQVAQLPLDFFSRGQAAWGNVVFLIIGTGCVLATGRPWLIAATLTPLTYFGFFDSTLSTHFFRHYLAIFPPLFIGIAIVCKRIRQATQNQRWWLVFIWPALTLTVILSGLAYLRPHPMPKLEEVTPPPELLNGKSYMVNSGCYHPESLIRRYPGKKFIGMPLDPAQFDEFSRHYQQFTTIIWHPQFSVQEPLFRHLTESGRYRIVASVTNKDGFPYLLLEKNDEKTPHIN